MNGSNGEFQHSVLPPVPEYPGILSKDLSESKLDLGGLPEQTRDQLLTSFDKRIDYETSCESHRHEEEKGRQKLAFASLSTVVIIVVSAFIYSGMTKDKTLSEKVINTMLGVLGGGGAVAIACVRKQN